MSLNAREQHTLNSMERQLAGSDPKLASLMATFTRLAAGEALPVRERIQVGWQLMAPPDGGRRHQRQRGTPSPTRSPVRQLVWPALWIVISLAVIAAALATGNAGGRSACTVRPVACAGQAPTAGRATGSPAAGSRPSAAR